MPDSQSPAVAARRRPRRLVPADFDAAEWSQIEPLLGELQGREIGSKDEMRDWLRDLSEVEMVVDEYGSRLYIDKSRHTEDEQVKAAYLHFVDEIEPKLKPAFDALKRKYLDSPHALTADDGEKFGILRRTWQTDVDLFREANIPLQTRETKIVTEYDETCGAMTIEFRGKTYTQQQMARFQEETDRDTREAAWKASADRRMQDREKIDGLFDEVLPLRGEIAGNAGFDSARDYYFKAKHRFDYTPDDCHRYAAAVEEHVVPVLRKLDAERRAELGVETLRPWDLAVDVRGRDPLRPFDESDTDGFLAKTTGIFRKLDPDLAEQFDLLRQAGHLDLESRPAKQPGGYQANLEESGIPFIFMNAAGLQRDVETLLHEGGHAFHTLLAHDEPYGFFRHAPMEFCEVASMSMELLALPHLDDFFENPADADRARRHQLEGVSILAWIATIDQFQHWLYTHPGHSRADREAAWLEVFARFGHEVDWTGHEDVRASLWQRQLHLFHVPFYYIEYGIAQLGALQLWLASKRDKAAALERYKHALSLGGTRPLPALFEAAGLKFDFSADTIAPLMAAVREDLDKLPA